MSTPIIRTSTPKVLVCPFCQHKPEVVMERVLNWVIEGQVFDNFKVQCKNYRCQIRPHVTGGELDEALKKWNDRDEK